MKTLKIVVVMASLVVAGGAGAGSNSNGYQNFDRSPRQDLYEYAQVVEVRPIYREVEVSRPVRECWREPVYHTHRNAPKSAGGMLAGGLIGGIVGHQIGSGSGNKLATAAGTLIGAKIGHDIINGQGGETASLTRYEEHCQTSHRVSYEEVVDGYDVAYRYRGRRYYVEMPYDPGKRIKMRIQFSPVI